jgi:hypothetical protein
MIKLKNILSEAYAWERQAGKPLPTLEQTTAAYAAKMAEQSAEQPISEPMDTPLKESDDIFDENKLNEGRTDALRNLLEKVYEDAIENVEYDEMNGYSSKPFNEYWNENRGEIAALLDVQIGQDASQQDNVFDIIMTYTKDPDDAEAAYDAWLNGDSMPADIEANVTRDPRWAGIRQPQREAARPDFLDLDGDGDEEESMKQAALDAEADSKEVNEEETEEESDEAVDAVDVDILNMGSIEETFWNRVKGNLHGHEYILREAFRK